MLKVESPRAAPPTRVLVLTAGYGEGHNAAARALAAALDAAAGPGTAIVVDVFALAAPRLNTLSRRGYLALINRAPRLWQRIYAWLDRSTAIAPRALGLMRRERRLLAAILARERPVAVCSTYPVYAFWLEKLACAGRLGVPHFNIVTDSISIHSLWWRADCGGWFVPNEDSAEVLHRVGLPPGCVHVCGFPVHEFFRANENLLTPPDLAPGVVPRVLHIVNSGTRGSEATARLLLAETDWEITITVGRDDRLRARLEQLAADRDAPTQILGWTDQIPRLLMTHHLVISKAGGATTQEAVAARCPMIVSQIVPGQEEGNYELLRRHGAGVLAETPAAILAACRRAFADDGRVWREWRTALAPLARPAAARAIALHVLSHARPATGPIPDLAPTTTFLRWNPRPPTYEQTPRPHRHPL